MSDPLAAVFADERIAKAACETTWHAARDAPELLAKPAESEPLVPALAELMRGQVPVMRQWQFGDVGPYVRPDRHVRAMYLDLQRLDGARTAGGCIAIKGGEALCENFEQIVERLGAMWNIYAWVLGTSTRQLMIDPGMLSAIERFPVVEGKPPGVHPHWDAEEEALCALELQRAHLARYGALARTPIPLAVARWSPAVADRIMGILEPKLSPKAKRTVRTELDAGLGVYVYYYPCVPLRVAHIQAPDATDAATHARRMTALRELCDPAETVDRWIDLTARVLALGYVATDPANLNRGYCVQPQNLVLDGGFVDVNSIRAIDTFMAEGEFRFQLHRTIQALATSLTWFVAGSVGGMAETPLHYADVHARTWSAVTERVAKIARGALHPWLAAALAARPLFDALADEVGQYVGLSQYHPTDREAASYRKR